LRAARYADLRALIASGATTPGTFGWQESLELGRGIGTDIPCSQEKRRCELR